MEGPTSVSVMTDDRAWKEATRGLTKFENDVVGQHSKLGNLSLFILQDAGRFIPVV
jgi:hypothetical protein